ncbi:ComF family protein [Microbacterium sp. NPDC055903]
MTSHADTDPAALLRAGRKLCEEVLGLLLGASCAGCDAPGWMLCEGCAEAVAPAPLRARLPRGGEATAALAFEGVAARCVRALKEEGATMLARPLGAALAAVIPPNALCVPVPTRPSAFRARGYRVPELLIRAAGARPVRLLASTGRASDQRLLGREQRAMNVAGTMRATRAGDGRAVVVVDDVVTTGATLSEASAVLTRAGFDVVGCVALAATARRGRDTPDSSEINGDIRGNGDYGRGSQGDHGPPLAGQTGTRRHEWKRASSAWE